jgi:hypothetical protein
MKFSLDKKKKIFNNKEKIRRNLINLFFDFMIFFFFF